MKLSKNRNCHNKKFKLFPNNSSASNNNNDQIVQDPVEVFCRIKPISESVSCISVLSATQLSLISPVSLKCRKLTNCRLNHIFTNKSNQKEIFDYVAKPLLKSLVEGENGLLLTYGVTGSGKTYSMCGEHDNPGIIPRCINVLFNSIGSKQTPKFLLKSDKLNGFELQEIADVLKDQEKERKMKRHIRKKIVNNSMENVFIRDFTELDNINKNFNYTIFVNYVEIYNNNTYDLLDENSGLKSLQIKILREDSKNNIYVNGVVEIEVKTAAEAFELFHIGNKRKRMFQTSLNSKSSRSHSIFTIRLVLSNISCSNENNKSLLVSQLSLVDLAGSERCNRTNSTGQRLKEAGSINNSLMALKTCMEILRENQKTGNKRLVPYRDSRLTLFFKNYFENEGNVKMILCVNPSPKDYDETEHVMKFAELSKEVLLPCPIIKITEFKTEHPEVMKINNKEKITEQPKIISKEKENFKQSLPKVKLCNPETEEIQSLILYLRKRREMSSNMKIIRDMTVEQFRKKLVDFEVKDNGHKEECKYLIPTNVKRLLD